MLVAMDIHQGWLCVVFAACDPAQIYVVMAGVRVCVVAGLVWLVIVTITHKIG